MSSTKPNLNTNPVVALVALLLSGCANLHQVQIAERDNTRGPLRKFDIKVSEVGVDLSDAAEIASQFSIDPRFHMTMKNLSTVWKTITYGPKTGNATFSSNYADGLNAAIAQACPPSNIAGLTFLRETTRYPVVSGEFVHVSGYCSSAKVSY